MEPVADRVAAVISLDDARRAEPANKPKSDPEAEAPQARERSRQTKWLRDL